MQHLIATPYLCRSRVILSVLNRKDHLKINEEMGVKALANSIGKINGYVALIRTLLNNSTRDEDLKALIDVLKGIVQDLYDLVSMSP